MSALKSNGFGRVEQRIVFYTPKINREFILNMELFELRNKEEKATDTFDRYVWQRYTTRTGDDETIVYELAVILNGVTNQWRINWSECTY